MTAEQRRLLVLITELERGGAEQVVVDLARYLDRAQLDVSVATLYGGGDLASKVSDAGVPLWNLAAKRGHIASSLFALSRLLASDKFDIVHSHLPGAGLAARLALTFAAKRTAHIYTEHNVPTGYGLPARVLNRLSVRRPDVTTAVSREVRRAWIAYGCRWHDKSEVVWNGVEIPELARNPAVRSRVRQELGLDESTSVLVTVANLHRRKGHDVLLPAIAAARLRASSVFLIVGDGPLRADLEAKSRELGISTRVRFLGTRRDVGDLLYAGDVFVLASLAEGLPMALLEAMARSLPCVATRVGGIPEAIEDGVNGLLVPPGDVAALTRSLEATDDQGIRRRIGDAGRRRVVRDFGAHQMAQRYQSIYSTIAHAQRAP